MGDALAHRGPDDFGTFRDDTAGLYLVFRRLAILDLSASGHQPMTSASGRYVIIFNGEVYNFEEIRAELSGCQWRGHSDTEVMLAAIEHWGLEAAVKKFVGMFALALWDRQERELHLVRDRLGIKPVYYGRAGADFVFASELKAIREHADFDGQIDRDALALYMRHGCVPAPHCIYKGLYKLPPGHILTISAADGVPVLRQFWSATDVAWSGLRSPFTGSDAEAIEQLEETLLAAVRLRMIADVPLGAFLSGGVDSSTVVALMQAQSGRPVKTFTVGFHEDGYNEARHAKKVAAHLGTEHTELYITSEEALAVVPLLPNMYDEPFADASQIPTYLISKLARGSVTVSLSGDGGDELFGGYNRYPLSRRLWNLMKKSPRLARKAAAGSITSIPPGWIDQTFRLFGLRLSAPGDKAHKLAQLLRAETATEIYARSLSLWDDPSRVVLNTSEPRTVLDSIDAAFRLPIMDEAMMLVDLVNYLPDDILTKVDRASMAVSLEARVPILDHTVVEFAWTLPLRFKIRDGTSKWILRQVLYKYVPAALLERPKMGFGIPIGIWLRGPLREWAEDLLSETSLAHHGMFDSAIIRMKWQEHISGGRNWQYLLWTVLIFQDWYLHTDHRTVPTRPLAHPSIVSAG
jgi:asparagine synthase (glutamine-hydrolysing)